MSNLKKNDDGDVLCTVCESKIEEDDNQIISGSGIWCSVECWEEHHGQPFL